MKYILAVSGGVDSVVLLDMATSGQLVIDGRKVEKQDCIIAHFDHGIRGEESRCDANFVKLLSQKYGVMYIEKQGNLTKNSSEDAARQLRYSFLVDSANHYNAKIVTAHHKDDYVETMAINVSRGTGWRGIAPFGNKRILRPLLSLRKNELYNYVLEHDLEWTEDATNVSNDYLRNRIRKTLNRKNIDTEQLVQLGEEQHRVKKIIETEIEKFLDIRSRHFYIMIDTIVGLELLRNITLSRLTRPQLGRLLHAIKTAKNDTTIECGNGIIVTFSTDEFVVKTPKEVI